MRRICWLLVSMVACLALLVPQTGFSSIAKQATPSVTSNPDSCITNYDENTDYFPDKVSVSYASHFQVRYEKNYKVVTVAIDQKSSPNTDRDVHQTYVLVQCGTATPALTGDLAEAQLIEVPSHRVALSYGEDAIFLATLGLTDRIVTVAGNRFINPELKAHIEDAQVALLGFPPNLEALVAATPDLAIFFAQNGDDFDQLDRIRQLGIPAVPSSKILEPLPLGRFEWIKYVAVFFNAEQSANSIFNPVAQNYETLTARAEAAQVKPGVLWADPESGDFAVVQNGWLSQLIADAGGVNVFMDVTANQTTPIGIEAVVAKASTAEYWITRNGAALLSSPTAGMEAIKAYADGNVFDFTKRSVESGGNDYYETGAVRPDLILQDLIAIFHPEIVSSDQLYFFQRVAAS